MGLSKKVIKTIMIVISTGVLLYFVILPLIPIFIFGVQYKFAKPEVNTNITKYEDYIGQNAKDRFNG